MVAAVALMALVSCNKEEINNNVVEQPQEPSYYVEFVASIAEDADTKAFDAATPKTYWVEGEAISINGKKFEVKEVLENGNAIFENKEELGEGFSAPYNAVYPYTAGTSFDAVTVPSEQTAVANNVAPEALVAVAQSDNNTLEFKHLTSLLKFQVEVACPEVTITSANALAGKVNVTSVEESNVEYNDVSVSTSVTIKGDFKTSVDYYVAVLPGAKTKFAVNVYGKVVKSAESVNVKRSTIMNMKQLPAPTLKLYVEDDTDYSALYLYMFDSAGNNTWPGTKITETETINGVSYKVYTVPTDRIGNEYTYIFNNNKGSQIEENKKIKFNQDNYLRVTKKYSETVTASNKGKDDPITLYIRNDKNWSKLNYYMWIPNGANNQGWPGKSADMSKKTKIDNATYYYVELGTHNYTRIIINNGSSQTNDLTIKSTKEDIYTANNDSGYCWKGSEQSL